MSEEDKINTLWTKSIMKFISIFISIIFVGEIILCIYYFKNNLINMSPLLYTMKNIVLPTSINLYIMCVSFHIIGVKKNINKTKTIVPIISMLLICLNFMIFHHKSPVCIISLLLPIILTINYTDSKATSRITLLCAFLSVLITLMLVAINNGIYDFNYLISSGLSLVFVLGITYMLWCFSVIENKKQKLLIQSIKEKNYYKTKSTTDPLTKCHNNAYYRSIMDSNLHKHKNSCLAIIDIDKFKDVNDTYGHANGDVVLRYLGSLLNKMNSNVIYTARYGGEEFTILFYDHTEEQAAKIMNKLRIKFGKHVFPELNNHSCTFSCGIARELKNDKAVELFKKADKALYIAKESGRNQVIIYDESTL